MVGVGMICWITQKDSMDLRVPNASFPLTLLNRCMDGGRWSSRHMKGLHAFTSVHVDPKMRRLRFEAYGLVAPLPFQSIRSKKALVKWAWKQPTIKG